MLILGLSSQQNSTFFQQIFISIKASMSRLRISHYCPYSEALLALSLRRAFP